MPRSRADVMRKSLCMAVALGSAGGSDQGVVALGIFMVGCRFQLLPVHRKGDLVAVGLNRYLIPGDGDLFGGDTEEASDIDDRAIDGAVRPHQQVADMTDLFSLGVDDRLADHALHGNACRRGWGDGYRLRFRRWWRCGSLRSGVGSGRRRRSGHGSGRNSRLNLDLRRSLLDHDLRRRLLDIHTGLRLIDGDARLGLLHLDLGVGLLDDHLGLALPHDYLGLELAYGDLRRRLAHDDTRRRLPDDDLRRLLFDDDSGGCCSTVTCGGGCWTSTPSGGC